MDFSKFKYDFSDKRKKQILKIIKYAKNILNINIKIIESSYLEESKTSAGGYSCATNNKSAYIELINSYHGLPTIFILLHEIGHHIDYLKRGLVTKEEVAYEYYPENINEAPCPEKYSKLIIHAEDMAVYYARELATFLDLKIPEFSLLVDEFKSKEALKIILKTGNLSTEDFKYIRNVSRKKAYKKLKKKTI